MSSFGSFGKKSSSADENSVLGSDESGRSRFVSEALQSSWVRRLRSGGRTQSPRPCAGKWNRISDGRIGSGFNEPSGILLQSSGAHLLEDKIEGADSAVHAHFPPEHPSDKNQSPRESVDREHPATETRTIASFGPFQVRARSLVLPKPSVLDVEEPSEAFMRKRTQASVPWKQYFHAIRRWDTESRTQNEGGERKEFRGGHWGSAPMDSCRYPQWERASMVKYCGNKRDLPWKDNQAASDIGRSTQLQSQAESQQLRSMGQNAGLCNGVRPFALDGDVHGRGIVMDGTSPKRRKIPFPNAVQRAMNNIESNGFVHYAQPSSLPSLIPHFTVSKQLLQAENCNNRHFVGQQGSESLPISTARQLESPARKHYSGRYGLTLPLGPFPFGNAQELGMFNTMERLPAYSAIHPIFGNQKDDMMPTDNSSSTASLPRETYANICNRTAKQTNSSEFHVRQSKVTTAIKGIDGCYDRPRRDPDFLEPAYNSHFSNCQWRHPEEVSTVAENRHSNRLQIAARHSVSDAKGKGPSIPRISWEQWHDRKHITSSKGAASHYNSDDDVIHRTLQEKYAGSCFHCSDSRPVSQSLAFAVQANAFSIPTKECQETVTVRDGDKKGISKKDKRSAVDQTVLQANGFPTGDAGYCSYGMKCDSCEYCHLKSRKQSAEATSGSQRVLILSNERDSKLDCDKYGRLTISAVDGHTLNSGKRIDCTLQDDLALGPTIASKAATVREVNARGDHRPQMWLQRWVHSGGSGELLKKELPRESMSCNLATKVGSLVRLSFGGWSGNNRTADMVQWTKGRGKRSIEHFSDCNAQPFGVPEKHITPSASAMAIVGTRDKEKYVSQPPWKRSIFSFTTSNNLDLKPTKNAFEQRTAEHKDAHT